LGYGTALKDALGKVAPEAVKPEPKREAVEAAGLPEDVLRSMLAVDPEGDSGFGVDDPDARKH
jgi:hypothetical protein